MSTRKELGRPVKLYPGRSIGWADFLLWVIPGALISIGLTGYGAYLRQFDYAQNVFRPEVWFAAGIIFLLPFAFVILNRFNSSGKAVGLYTKGLRLKNIVKQDVFLPWNRISGVRTSVSAFHFLGLPVKNRHIVYIEPDQGPEIRLSDEICDLEELVELIKNNVYPILLPEMTTGFKQGNTIRFGKIQVNRQQVIVKSKPIPLDSIRELKVESGTLFLKSDRYKSIRLQTSGISNVELLLSLINQHFITNALD